VRFGIGHLDAGRNTMAKKRQLGQVDPMRVVVKNRESRLLSLLFGAVIWSDNAVTCGTFLTLIERSEETCSKL
jgi:hypothetical protein